MQTPFELQRLRALRSRGQSPSLPVFLTNNWQFEQNLKHCGALVIRVVPENYDENWDAIAGLDVILAMPDSQPFTPLMKAVRECRPRRMRGFHNEYLTTIWRGR